MSPELLNTLSIIIGGGGIVGGIVALLKVKPETARVIVSAAEGAVIVQKGVITSLRNENTRLGDALKDCEEENGELRDLVEIINERKMKRRREELLPEEAPHRNGEHHDDGGENGVD